MFSPLLVAVNAVPKIALGPLLVVSLGWGQRPILTMVFLLSFFPIVLSTATGLTTTPADLAELARSLDASRWQAFRKVRLPAALPQIFVGLKVAMPLAAIGAVIGEFQAGEGGLGYQIVQYSGVADSATAWAAIILVGVMSIVLYFALLLVERLALPWVRETTSAR
jgi:NitT/TauT family transport system permease protein